MKATHVISDSMMEIVKDTTVPACERVEAARLLLSLGGWEPQGEEANDDEEVSELMSSARNLIYAIHTAIRDPHLLYVESWAAALQLKCNEVEAAITALEDET